MTAARSAGVPGARVRRTGDDPPGAVPASRAGTAADAEYALTAPDGTTFASAAPGTLGGHRRSRIYGRLDCRTAQRAIERGGYVRDRVFFADEPAARAAGYRPCAVCLPREYAAWKGGG